MAIGLLFDGSGVTQAQYEQVLNDVTANGTRQVPGMLTHHAGPTDGGFCVVETWESQEALQDFFEQHLGQALAAAGIQVQPKFFEIVNSVVAGG
jgi:quinol monooxygenase YgiN